MKLFKQDKKIVNSAISKLELSNGKETKAVVWQ